MMVIYYVIAVLIQPINFGLYFNALLNFIGIHGTGLGTWLVGALLATAIVAPLVYRGITVSTESAIAFIAFESLVLLALAITIIVNKGIHGGLTLAPLNPGKVTGGGSALWSAMILVIFSYTGYDVVSTVAEEAKAPRRFLPRATLMALITVGFFWVFCSFALSISTPTSRISALISEGLTPITPIAKQYWGWGQIFVIITAMTAAVGVYVATAVGASRALFAMAREGLLPVRLARLHPRHRVPSNAITLVFVAAVLGAVLVVFVLGNAIEGITWWGDGIALFALVTYIGVNLANIAHFRRRPNFNWFLNLVVPVVGTGLCGYLIYRGFVKANLAVGWRLGGSVMVASGLASLVAIFYVAWLWRTRRSRFEGEPPELAITPEAGGA
jgi:amino acid transporter